MNDRELPPTTDGQAQDPPASERGSHLVRNLMLALVLVAVGLGFGIPIAKGYYFGGCDDDEGTEHYLIHVFGVKMCRDAPVETGAEMRARKAAESTPFSELTEEGTSTSESVAPETASPEAESTSPETKPSKTNPSETAAPEPGTPGQARS
jgi:hypothetical protein